MAINLTHTSFTPGTVITASQFNTNFTEIEAQGVSYIAASWTPVLTFGGLDVGLTYASRTATVIRLNDLVILSFDITLSSKGSSTGSVSISGMPVLANVTAGLITFASGMTGVTGQISLSSVSIGGTGVTSFALEEMSSTGTVALTDAEFTNSSRIVGFTLCVAA